jgi:glutathionylspermidine synthase
MRRIGIVPRPDWREKVEAVGLTYHTLDDAVYWDESACYRFTADEVDRLEQATTELQEMCVKAAGHVIEKKLFRRFGIPEAFAPLVVDSWERDDPSLYGRFDLLYDGTDIKLLEYNADTPTALLEASVVQWFWMKECFPDADQFNSIHEKLIASWKTWPRPTDRVYYFACVADSVEDLGNTEYLRDTAVQGGLETRPVFIEDIGWDPIGRGFVDLEGCAIRSLFKLYPWEWLIGEEFGPRLLEARTDFIEPAWKMILSNKGILAVLWDLFEGHPLLLEAHFEEGVIKDGYVRKPLLSREGENILIAKDGAASETEGTYGAEGYVYQRYRPLPEFEGNYPVIGSWIIGGEPAGMGIREDRTEITKNTSRFIPHLFEEA